MLSWIAAIAAVLALVALFIWVRIRAQQRRSSAEMRDYMRRNFRIGEKPWE